ncbi:O-antigen ligase family protein [Salisediminibacterium selenitireducens]|uniref:O-antigen polymerase n=1 Tax=Bacillus selenitireducens (strain ATCC 700615 / DSM 15326 / MLS10) TaxID=439292 RepID=D6Y0E3_BACIE|nr:O-antigen ligase family protein [Salisediminibacterium selenitireducens]ADH98534.1 O-antigen polymerase [[Bacillus] selenitireducens MLS10]
MSVRDFSLTFYSVLLLLFFIPLLDFKYYLGPLPLSAEVFLIPLLIVVAFYEYRRGDIQLTGFRFLPMLIAFASFFIVSLISLVNAVSLMAGLMEIARYLSYVLMVGVVIQVSFSRKEYIYFLWTFVASTSIVILIGSIQYVFDLGLNTAGLYALNDAIGRVESTMVNPNYYAAFINFVLPGAMILAVMYTKNRPAQAALFLITGVLVANMVLTYTRVAWLIMFGAIVLVVLLAGKEYLIRMSKVHMLVMVAILAVFVYQMPDFQSRTVSAIYVAENMLFDSDFFGQGEVEDNDLGLVDEEEEEERVRDEMSERAMVSRTTLWRTGWVMFADNPVLGVGAGNYLERYSDYVEMYPELYLGHDRYSVHNSYLKVMAESGIIGLVAFMSVYVLYYIYLIRFYFQQPNLTGKLVAVSVFIGSITFMLQNTSNNLIFIPQINIIFWLVSALAMNYLYVNRKQ